MKKSVEELLDKVNRMIETSDEQHKDCVERYISLVIKRLHQEGVDNWCICGVSIELRGKCEDKFGAFVPRNETVVDM